MALVLVGSAWVVLHFSSRPTPPTRPAPPEPAILRDWNALLAKADVAPRDPEHRRSELRDFRMRYPGTPQAVQAAELERKLPSPLDSLDGTVGRGACSYRVRACRRCKVIMLSPGPTTYSLRPGAAFLLYCSERSASAEKIGAGFRRWPDVRK